MKTKVLLTTVLTIFLSAGIYAQNSYQTFLANGFKVKSGCEFEYSTKLHEIMIQALNLL